MPQCSDYGEGWSGEYPNCTYSAPSFGGGVGSLGFQDILPSQVQGTPWSEFFDPYDPAKQQIAEAGAEIDVGQLQDVWSLQQQQLGEAYGLQTGQLGETWGVQKTALGAGAGRGVRDARRSGAEAMRKGGMAYSGTAVEAQKTAEADVMAEYTGGIQAGQTAYQQALGTAEMDYGQALETGELGVTQATTDIGQQLQEDIFGYQEAWEREQRSTLNVLLGMDIWGDDTTSTTTEAIGGTIGGNIPYGVARGYQNWSGTWDGTTQPPSNFGQYYPTIGNWTWDSNQNEYVYNA